jgi:outer membrane receptor protein involved in Fe transport
MNSNGYFYMKDSATTPTWYRFKLVDVTRSKSFVQPKFGLTYNIDQNFSAFANFSYVQRMLDLSVFYNSGNPNPNAEDEKSTQIEFGGSYIDENMFFKANLYQMSWENKTASIVDLAKAGLPGYDRNGQKFELVGSSRNRGIELEGKLNLGMFNEMLKGLSLNVAGSFMDNKWIKVLDEVKKDLAGKRRAFDAGALTAAGTVDTLYFDELEGTVNASTPFTTINLGLSYEYENLFVGLTSVTAMNFYALDGASYIAVDGTWDNSGAIPKFIPKYDNKLPSSTVIDLQAGYTYRIAPVTLNVTAQVLNLFNKEFLVNANRSGVLPGLARSFRLNFAASL